jgi:hypothetical protein
MMARHEIAGRADPDERDRLRAALIDAIEFSHEVLSEGALRRTRPGLSAGLVALEAVILLTTRLQLSGDVPADDPVAAAPGSWLRSGREQLEARRRTRSRSGCRSTRQR